jgi:hypothetical protein
MGWKKESELGFAGLGDWRHGGKVTGMKQKSHQGF